MKLGDDALLDKAVYGLDKKEWKEFPFLIHFCAKRL